MCHVSCVLCHVPCQEVGTNYQPTLRASLEAQGYEGQFLAKELGTEEGEATFWRRGVWRLLEARHLTFNQLLEGAVARAGLATALAAEVARDHVVLVTKLEHRATGRALTVANLHTIWDDFRQLDVAALHVAMAVRAVAGEGAVVVAGDYNSLPSMEPYLLATQGGLTPAQLEGLRGKGGGVLGEAGPLATCLAAEFTTPTLHLASAYKVVRGEEPRLTNFDDYDGSHPADWCLDYLLYSPAALAPTMVLDTVGVPEARIPDSTFPSDHLSIKAAFTFL